MIKEQFKDYINLSKQVIHVDRPKFDFAFNMTSEAIEITRKYPVKIVTQEKFDLTQYEGKNVYCVTALFTVYITNLKVKHEVVLVAVINDDYDKTHKLPKRVYLVDYDAIVAEDNPISTVVNEVQLGVNIDFSKFKNED